MTSFESMVKMEICEWKKAVEDERRHLLSRALSHRAVAGLKDRTFCGKNITKSSDEYVREAFYNYLRNILEKSITSMEEEGRATLNIEDIDEAVEEEKSIRRDVKAFFARS